MNATVSQKLRSIDGPEQVREAGLPLRREVTLFRSLGLAMEDVATVDLVYRKALNEDGQGS
jgi:ornithine cyclodeaminase/alanine dehydrogenase-like protein (mu-crystallin family)